MKIINHLGNITECKNKDALKFLNKHILDKPIYFMSINKKSKQIDVVITKEKYTIINPTKKVLLFFSSHNNTINTTL